MKSAALVNITLLCLTSFSINILRFRRFFRVIEIYNPFRNVSYAYRVGARHLTKPSAETSGTSLITNCVVLAPQLCFTCWSWSFKIVSYNENYLWLILSLACRVRAISQSPYYFEPVQHRENNSGTPHAQDSSSILSFQEMKRFFANFKLLRISPIISELTVTLSLSDMRSSHHSGNTPPFSYLQSLSSGMCFGQRLSRIHLRRMPDPAGLSKSHNSMFHRVRMMHSRISFSSPSYLYLIPTLPGSGLVKKCSKTVPLCMIPMLQVPFSE